MVHHVAGTKARRSSLRPDQSHVASVSETRIVRFQYLRMAGLFRSINDRSRMNILPVSLRRRFATDALSRTRTPQRTGKFAATFSL